MSFQTKYKEASKKQTSTPLYHRLPETLETQHAKEASQLQSQVRTDVMGQTQKSVFITGVQSLTLLLLSERPYWCCLLCMLQILYKEAGKKEMSRPVYHQLPDTLENQFARELSGMQSQVRAPTLYMQLWHLHLCPAVNRLCTLSSHWPLSPHWEAVESSWAQRWPTLLALIGGGLAPRYPHHKLISWWWLATAKYS